jgi:apolipoprotein N-acyltransferase
LAITSGLLLTASFPKIGISKLAWVALVPLLGIISDSSPKEAFRLGVITGLSHYLTLLYWLINTMMTYGYLPVWVAVPLLFLLAAYLSLYIGVFSMVLSLCRKPLYGMMMAPALWVALEYLRTFLLTGFPWGLLGYSQVNYLHMIQIADIFGVYGVSFLVVFANGVFCLTPLFPPFLKGGRGDLGKSWEWGLFTLILLIAGASGYGIWQINRFDALAKSSPSARITVVQGNIPQTEKWDQAFRTSTVLKYLDLSLSAAKEKPDLVVLPETALPFYFLYDPILTKLVQEGIRSADTHFLIGSPAFLEKANETEYYNSAYLIAPDGNSKGRYDKVHLVPYGEYVPLKKWMPFLGKIVEHVGDFKSGKKGSTLQSGNLSLGLQICYEIVFPALSGAMAENGATLLVNITNDAWFGTSSAPYQHFDMAVFRTVENKRALVRSANTGISGFIDPAGRIIAATPLFKEAAVTRTVPLIQQKTIYTRFGDWFAIICCLAVVFIFAQGLKRI